MLESSRPSLFLTPQLWASCPFASSETWNQSLSGVPFYRTTRPWGEWLPLSLSLPLSVGGARPKGRGGELVRPSLSVKPNLIHTATCCVHTKRASIFIERRLSVFKHRVVEKLKYYISKINASQRVDEWNSELGVREPAMQELVAWQLSEFIKLHYSLSQLSWLTSAGILLVIDLHAYRGRGVTSLHLWSDFNLWESLLQVLTYCICEEVIWVDLTANAEQAKCIFICIENILRCFKTKNKYFKNSDFCGFLNFL